MSRLQKGSAVSSLKRMALLENKLRHIIPQSTLLESFILELLLASYTSGPAVLALGGRAANL